MESQKKLTKNENLKTDIRNSSMNIEKRKKEIEHEIENLSKKIYEYTNWAWFFVWIGLAVGALSLLYFICKNTEKGFGLNLLGDFMAGTVASIWSLAGLFFIYVAFLGQKQQLLNQQLELMYSQLELKYTRLELKGQKKEMSKQNGTLKQQKFENTFFQMLNLFHSIINSSEIRSGIRDVTHSGRDCFKYFVRELKKEENNTLQSLNSFDNLHDFNQEIRDSSNLTLEEIQNIYDVVYQKHKSNLSHYFRTLYHIVKFIDESEIKDKRKYISITRAQLSSYEQVLLYYNCIHSNGNKRFKPLIEKYSLLHNIDGNELLDLNHYKNDFYLESAFENENI